MLETVRGAVRRLQNISDSAFECGDDDDDDDYYYYITGNRMDKDTKGQSQVEVSRGGLLPSSGTTQLSIE